MSVAVDSKLQCFFIFNPEFGSKEGEENKKILFYYPPSDSIDTQVRTIGFCEAAVRFADSFVNKESTEHVVNTTNLIQVYYRPEEQFFMGMNVAKSLASDGAKKKTEFISEEACQSILRNAYRMFRLFNGTFSYNLKLLGASTSLCERLKIFYSRYIGLIKFSPFQLIDILDGVDYMPLDSLGFLKIQSLMNRIKEAYPCIAHTVLLYDTKLVWYTIPDEDINTVYRYLANNVLPSYLKSELQPGFRSMHQQFGKYIMGPPDLNDTSNLGKIPIVFLMVAPSTELLTSTTPSDELSAFHLVAYRVLNATLCLLLPHSVNLEFDFFRTLDETIGQSMRNLASSIGDVYVRIPLESQHQYIYYNKETSNLRISLAASADSKSAALSDDVVVLLCSMHDDLKHSEYLGDIIVKLESDVWVAAKKAGRRELYVIVNQKNANITDVAEEVGKLCAANFGSMFLQE